MENEESVEVLITVFTVMDFSLVSIT